MTSRHQVAELGLLGFATMQVGITTDLVIPKIAARTLI